MSCRCIELHLCTPLLFCEAQRFVAVEITTCRQYSAVQCSFLFGTNVQDVILHESEEKLSTCILTP
jgi:hypothetical protein